METNDLKDVKSKLTIKAEGIVLNGNQFEELKNYLLKLKSSVNHDFEIELSGFFVDYRKINL
jgi:hypothetical protein